MNRTYCLFRGWQALLATFAGLFLLASCLTGGSSTTDTGSEISISGRVIDRDNAPVQGVVVVLLGAGLADTTDAQGQYHLEGPLAKSLPVGSKKAADPVLDTLLFKRVDQPFAALPVTKWIEKLPDLRVIQRDISGTLLAGTVAVGRVEAVITGEWIPAHRPVRVETFYNSLANHYSGFAYFQGTASVVSYAVYVDVFDTAGRFVGRSITVPFNSNAGNIVVPAFNPGNALPRAIAGRDTVLSVGDTLRLRGAAVDSFGGVISRWDWDVGGAGFRQTDSGDTVIVLPVIPNAAYVDTGLVILGPAYPLILRVTDDDGNTGLDTMLVRIVQDPPRASLTGAATAKVNVALALTAQVTQRFGSIVMYKWDDGKVLGWNDSASTLSATSFTYQARGTYVTRVYVRDDDGNADSVTHSVTVGNDDPVVSGMRDTTISINDSVTFTVSASDPEGIRRYLWDMDGNGVFEDTTTTPVRGRKYPATAGIVRSIVRVEDNFDGVTLDTAVVTLVQDKPVPAINGNTSVKVNVPLALTAQATQQFGSIVMYKWDDGKNPGWDDSSATLAAVSFTYQARGAYPVRLYVRDDDGNVDSVSRTVTVTNDNPVVSGLRDTTVSINDSVTFTVSASDPEGIRRYLWDMDGNGVFEDTTSTGNVRGYRFPSTAGTARVIVRVEDNFDGVTLDTAVVTVVLDKPVPAINGNTSVKVNVPLALTAQATQQFGSIVMYKWDDGKNPGWGDSSATLTAVSFTYQARGTYPVRLYVRDDDGNADSVSRTVTVTNDNPVVSGLRDTTVSINDSVTFTVSASDPEGIRRYLWDMDGNGVFEDTTSTGNVRGYRFPSTAGTARVIVRVEDNFDGVTLDTAVVTVVLDKPVPKITGPSFIKVGDSATLAGSATQQFGSIVMYKWDDGKNPGWDDSGATLTQFRVAYMAKGSYPVRLYVRDDDGNVDSTMFNLPAVNDDPVVSAMRDTVVGTGEAVTLTVNATDPDGISRYIWDVGGAGTNLDTTISGTKSILMPSLAQKLMVVLRVEDHFDGVKVDTITIDVLKHGLKWIKRSSPPIGQYGLLKVRWLDNLFVAVGSPGVVLTSPNGIDWSQQETPERNLQIMDVAWGRGRYVAVSIDGSVITSTDGTSWVFSRLPPDEEIRALTAVTWVDSQFVAVGSGGKVLTSVDGFTWVTRVPPTWDGPPWLYTIVWDGDQFIAGGAQNNAGYIQVSTDGLVWNRVLSMRPNGPINDIIHVDEKLVAVGQPGVLTSSDGISWLSSPDVHGYGKQNSVAWGDSVMIAVGTDYGTPGVGNVSVSTDLGLTWFHVPKFTSEEFKSVAWDGTRFVAVGYYGGIFTSP